MQAQVFTGNTLRIYEALLAEFRGKGERWVTIAESGRQKAVSGNRESASNKLIAKANRNGVWQSQGVSLWCLIPGIWSKWGSKDMTSKFLTFARWPIKTSVIGSVIPCALRVDESRAASSQSFKVISK